MSKKHDPNQITSCQMAWKFRRRMLNQANHIMFLAGGTEEDVIRIAEYQGLNADLLQNSNEELQDLLDLIRDEYGQ